MTEPARHLQLVDPETGELVDPARCPHCEKAEAEAEEIDKKFKGLLLENRKLKADRQADILASPERPVVELLHACHAAATKANPNTPSRRKQLDTKERENATVCVRRLGLRTCLEAIIGLTWDPNFSPPRRNGTRECHNTFELCFRTESHVLRFAERIPQGWEPEPEKIAEIAGVPVGWVKERLA